jgi:hypothetical protein
VKESNQTVEQMLADLTNEQLPVIDFDRLAILLTQQAGEMKALKKVRREAEILRADYESRIGGMLKAIALADRKREKIDEALEAVQSLATMSSAELVESYRLVSARFRDSFPTSFGQLAPGMTKRPRQFADFK